MDGEKKQAKSSALTNANTNTNTKRPSRTKCKRVSYAEGNNSDDDSDEDHVTDSDSEAEFVAPKQKSTKQKSTKPKKSQKKQVASTSTALVVASEPTTLAAKKKAETQKKKKLAKAHNEKLNGFLVILNKDKRASGVNINKSTIKNSTVKIRLSSRLIRLSSKIIFFDEQETLLITERSWVQDRFKAIMLKWNTLSEAEKRPFLDRILQDPPLWDDYSSLTPATQELFSEYPKTGNVQLNFPIEKEFHSMRQQEITFRGLVKQPKFDTVRKNSIIHQLVRTIIGEIDKGSKPKAKKQKATFKLQNTSERASAALANGRPQDVIMESNHWKEFASFLYM